MPGTIFNLPFDEELFMQMWSEVPDPTKTAILNSGVMVPDSQIANMIRNDGNIYTIPFYNTLDGEPLNYDGATDNTPSEIGGTYQTGVVYGRMKAWTARDFAGELSGGDPMGHITGSVGRYWNKRRQAMLLHILAGVFAVTGSSGNAKKWAENNSVNLAASKSGDTARPIGETDMNDLLTQAAGDSKSEFALAIMHSQVAKNLENKQLLEYWKGTDANGIQRPLNLASYGGLTVIIDDTVPVDDNATTSMKDYTTYFLGRGVIRQADGRLDNPVETSRDPEKNGGMDILYTKIRETLHPNGFSYIIPTSGWKQSPTDAQLNATGRWNIVFDPKSIPMARLITNG